jgi:hypothetical protein
MCDPHVFQVQILQLQLVYIKVAKSSDTLYPAERPADNAITKSQNVVKRGPHGVAEIAELFLDACASRVRTTFMTQLNITNIH